MGATFFAISAGLAEAGFGAADTAGSGVLAGGIAGLVVADLAEAALARAAVDGAVLADTDLAGTGSGGADMLFAKRAGPAFVDTPADTGALATAGLAATLGVLCERSDAPDAFMSNLACPTIALDALADDA